MRSSWLAQSAACLLVAAAVGLTFTVRASEAQEPTPGARAAAEMRPGPDFQRMSRELQRLASDVQTLLEKLGRDSALRQRLDAAARSKDYRAVEAVLRAAGVPMQDELHVLDGETAGRIKIRICIKWNPEVNISIEW